MEIFRRKHSFVIKGSIGWYVLKLDNPDDAVRRQSDRTRDCELLHGNQDRNRIGVPGGFCQTVGEHRILILTIGQRGLFHLLLVTGNTMAISVRERTGELAVLKAIGFTDRFVLFLFWRRRW